MTATWESPGAFLGETPTGDDTLCFALGRHLHGAFGGTFGGAVAAACISAARRAAPNLVTASADVRFMRGLSGSATLRATVLHPGRSLWTVSVDVIDEGGKLAARATIGLVAPASLHRLDDPGGAPRPAQAAYADGSDWRAPTGVEIPILATLHPRVLDSGSWEVSTGIVIPWSDRESSAEAVCLAADLCVGPPVAAVCAGQWIPHPNPDLSLRFVGTLAGPELAAVGRLERVHAGLAAVAIQVWSGPTLVGVGVSTSMLLAGGGAPSR